MSRILGMERWREIPVAIMQGSSLYHVHDDFVLQNDDIGTIGGGKLLAFLMSCFSIDNSPISLISVLNSQIGNARTARNPEQALCRNLSLRRDLIL
jgi:hypothetical protein